MTLFRPWWCEIRFRHDRRSGSHGRPRTLLPGDPHCWRRCFTAVLVWGPLWGFRASQLGSGILATGANVWSRRTTKTPYARARAWSLLRPHIQDCVLWNTYRKTATLRLANKWISEFNTIIGAIAPARRADMSPMKPSAHTTVSKAKPINARNAAFLSVMPGVYTLPLPSQIPRAASRHNPIRRPQPHREMNWFTCGRI